MGYTHYFKNPKGFSDEQWNAFTKDVKRILKNTDIPIVGPLGEKDTKPIIDNTKVAFNGLEEDSHETLYITKDKDDFSFCKTAQKPYDKVVVDVLKSARNFQPCIELSSDGDEEVFL